MANNINGYGGNAGNNKSSNRPGSTGNPVESAELTADDYEIIAAGLGALGEFFAFLALVKAKQVAKETGGQVDIEPALFIQSRKKAAKRKSRQPRR
ncbi:hypothetical protein R70723_22730 [Paenibacillus sp. FSL R7-0273]|uniref:hypothetical protein n=1 Tax=Paenibacillus sp. FSL R7-0273 TaxID=1536772 RepID=UPI0004F88204|nr:hypothetical protein [Paenibacillus sp. FSL R7-0273]AIQ48415.1 hypothetical protein R70723_22730 [Paenibacillus sp. FSL R7-0273]OMF88437.1 hypothetical protein BK144_21600 [Paenibacillus sp. FSL R7-0273]